MRFWEWLRSKAMARCPACGSYCHNVVGWIRYHHYRPVRQCRCGHVWCDYPGIEIKEASNEQAAAD